MFERVAESIRTILVVDNDPAVLKFMTMFLGREGFEVRTACDGLDALNVLSDFEPDVIFVDLIMPNIGGKKLCQILRSKGRYDETYLIVLSAISSEEEIDYTAMGFDACIAKGPLKGLGVHILTVMEKLGREITRSNPGSTYGAEDLYKREITSELLSTKRHAELIVENMSEGIVEATSEKKIIFANPAAVTLLDMPEEDLLGRDFQSLFETDAEQKIDRAFTAAMNGDEGNHLEEPIDHGDRLIMTQILPVYDEGRTSMVIIMNDITERMRAEKNLRRAHNELESRVKKRTEELQRANASLTEEIEQRRLLENDLRTSLKEKETMLNEIHHRVKNNLQVVSSLLGSYSRRVKNEDVTHMVKEMQNRIQSMSLVHEKLYRSQNFSAVDFGDYLRSFIRHLVHSFAIDEHRVKTIIDVEPVHLGIDIAVPCALIVNELVTNSLKHAFPGDRKGEIAVSFRMNDSSGCLMRIGDDGVGLPDDVDTASPESLGLRIVHVLTKQLDGTLRINRESGLGYTIEFPWRRGVNE